ncbi:hypothetical protein ISCGN_008813 [Ixodes scapularis]
MGKAPNMPLPNMSQQETTKKNGPSVDACWHVVLITAVVTFIGVSLERAMNYLYVAIMDEFGVDRETASWPMSVMTSLGGVIGQLCSTQVIDAFSEPVTRAATSRRTLRARSGPP